jgi:hypothetical protein
VRFLAVSLVMLGLAACDDVHHADSRYATPERTLATLLASYGLADKSLAEIQSLRRTGRLRVRDAAAAHACFESFAGAEDEALAGYIVGVLASADGSLRPTIAAGTARVAVGDTATLVLHDHDGAWRIDLPASVPVSTREAIHQAVMRAGNER